MQKASFYHARFLNAELSIYSYLLNVQNSDSNLVLASLHSGLCILVIHFGKFHLYNLVGFKSILKNKWIKGYLEYENKNTGIPSIKVPFNTAHRNHYIDSYCTLASRHLPAQCSQ